MNKILELLDENGYWFLNRFCFGDVFERTSSKKYQCDQCGDINGTFTQGNFKHFFDELLKNEIEYNLECLIEEGKYGLYQASSYRYGSDIYSKPALIDVLMKDSGFLEDDLIDMYIEGESYSLFLEDIPKELILTALNSCIIDDPKTLRFSDFATAEDYEIFKKAQALNITDEELFGK